MISIKKATLIILLIYNFVESYSQIDSTRHRYSISINLANLLIENISLDLTTKIHKNIYIEFEYEYRHGSKKDSAIIFFHNNFEDAFWQYETHKFRLGLRYYFNKGFYFCPMAIYNFRQYSNKYFIDYENHNGDLYDVDYVISRKKYDYGVVLKYGFSYVIFHHLYLDAFIGSGFKEQIIYKTINNKIGFHVHGNYPISSTTYTIYPTFHVGVLIGFSF
jgi:hypothetical protein